MTLQYLCVVFLLHVAPAHCTLLSSPNSLTTNSHNVEAQIAERSDQELRRLLAGRRSAAALQWLLKRQQERSRSEHDLFKVGEAAGGP